MKRKIIALLAAVLLALGIAGVSAQPAGAAVLGQTFKVAPRMSSPKSVKVSQGAFGWGARETVKPGGTAKKVKVFSIYVPPHCVLRGTTVGFNFNRRNDSNKGKWINGVAMPYGRTTVSIVCR